MKEVPQTKGQMFKVISKWIRGTLRKNIFTQRVLEIWKLLPERVLATGTSTTFKNGLDEQLNSQRIENDGLSAVKWEQY